MSAFLGPIHFWLYNKIKIQNDIVEDIISLAESENLNEDLRNNLYEQFGDGNLKPLEEVIDVTNIHGWLQERVSQVEYKLAYVVTEMLNKKPEMIEKLKILFKNMATRVTNINQETSLNDAFKAINDILLDGMPCDHANVVLKQQDDEIIWKRNVCVHHEYWDAAEGDVANYYKLREEFVKGLLSNSNINYEKLDDVTSKISRR
ncbi:hypothetical protein [Sedimentibacter sp. MB31-C6]|uniref:hypothetical protein n=1 Tax=Sedimentibacter sp. MB31-C6 TaxID=3109366 RepID=UPI002DDD1953|nr:hypothetical protein [Sedimentibacter sp. MB36-C1]WSI03282.1 hypothetical protein U8307_09515 [Sedimentibacter sp. MB36-C1]